MGSVVSLGSTEGSLSRIMPVIQRFDQVTAAWLTAVLGEEVADVKLSTSTSTWAQNASIVALMASGLTRSFWIKLCTGGTFGRSEVDYYFRDYVDLADAPLVTCYDACWEPGVGYHVLLEDMSAEFRDRKTAPPTLEHGLALAAAIARLHAHHWENGSPPTADQWDVYFEQISPGIDRIEEATGRSFRAKFESHAARLRQRWSNPVGLTLLHGDINPTNVLSPKGAESPVYFLDRQPFDWGITYGLAAYDLAYAIVPWWPYDVRTSHQEIILRHWFDHLGQPGYTWEQAQRDWDLSVEHCLHIPIEWCRDPGDVEKMRGLWEWQLGNITGQGVRGDL
jgi:hypothetical protein